ncbi:MAG TPA: helix-turn-helix transcriptional regulator, partial [Chryseobacterium sp.]
QVQSVDFTDSETEEMVSGKGFVLFFHPEFLAKYPIAATIKHFGFFSYAVNEALHLSEKEEENIIEILLKIKNEYQHIDAYTQDVIISQIELLLNYCNRYYQRQFFTRKSQNTDLLIKMEQILNDYFNSEEPLINGLPTVEFIAGNLNLSTHYLTDMLRVLTGQNTQQHIQEKILEKAKEYLLSTEISVSEIAYQLGFEYPQSFNKMFKKKMEISPLEFRQSFN